LPTDTQAENPAPISSPTAISEPISAPDWLTTPMRPAGSVVIADSESVDDMAVRECGFT